MHIDISILSFVQLFALTLTIFAYEIGLTGPCTPLTSYKIFNKSVAYLYSWLSIGLHNTCLEQN